MRTNHPSEAYLQILSKPELFRLWTITEVSLTNCTLQPYSIEEYGDLTGTFYDRGDFVGSMINKAENNEAKQFTMSIVIGKKALLVDIAHEIAHLYLHSCLGYPMIWLKPELWESSNELVDYQYATFIYVAAVHPIIDRFLAENNLFNPAIYRRILDDYKRELIQYLKNPHSKDKKHFLIKTLATLLRLPAAMWDEIQSEFKERNSFIRLMNQVIGLPEYPEDPKPQTIHEYVTLLWNQLRLNGEESGYRLSFKSPLLLELKD